MRRAVVVVLDGMRRDVAWRTAMLIGGLPERPNVSYGTLNECQTRSLTRSSSMTVE